MRKHILLLSGLLLVSLILASCSSNLNRVEDPAKGVGVAFLTALQDHNYEAAYNLATGDLQAELGGSDFLQVYFPRSPLILGWTAETRPVGEETNIDNAMGMFGEMSYGDVSRVDYVIVLVPGGGGFEVAGIEIIPTQTNP